MSSVVLQLFPTLRAQVAGLSTPLQKYQKKLEVANKILLKLNDLNVNQYTLLTTSSGIQVSTESREVLHTTHTKNRILDGLS